MPYVCIPLCKENDLIPINRVYVGPTHSPEMRVTAAMSFLDSQGYDGDRVVCDSDIPFMG